MTLLYRFPAHATLVETFQSIKDQQLARIFGPVIVERSLEYIEAIDQVDYLPGQAKTRIWGTSRYTVSLEVRADTLYGRCSCPYDGGPCKHLAAFVQYLAEVADESELAEMDAPQQTTLVSKKTAGTAKPAGAENPDFERWLEGRSKSELKAIVMQLATPAFRKSVALQQADPKTQKQFFEKAGKKLRDMVEKIDYEDDAETIEKDLLERLETLRPFWMTEWEAVTKLLEDILKGIDEAQDEGYLFGYDDGGGFEGLLLGAYMANFVAALPGEQAARALGRVSAALKDQSYSVCENFIPESIALFSDSQLVSLKTTILHARFAEDLDESARKLLWVRLNPLLDAAEQRQFLEKMPEPFFVLLLADLLEAQGEVAAAIKAVEKALPKQNANAWFYNRNQQGLFERRLALDQKYRKSKNLETWATRFISEERSAASLQSVLQYLPGDKAHFEKLLQTANISAYAEYLESAGRLEEVLELFKQNARVFHPQNQYDFFKRHKKRFPTEAAAAFTDILRAALPHTGDNNYRIVTEALVELKAISPAGKFQALAGSIRGDYYRRRNMLEMMDRAGV